MKQEKNNSIASLIPWACIPPAIGAITCSFIYNAAFMQAVVRGDYLNFNHGMLWTGLALGGFALLTLIGLEVASHYLDR